MQNIKMTISSLAITGILALGIVVHSPMVAPEMNQAHAASDTQRFDQCQDLKDAGRWNWSGIATGSRYGSGGRYSRTGFHIRSCHSTREKCQRWVRNVYNEITRIDTLRGARCVAKR